MWYFTQNGSFPNPLSPNMQHWKLCTYLTVLHLLTCSEFLSLKRIWVVLEGIIIRLIVSFVFGCFFFTLNYWENGNLPKWQDGGRSVPSAWSWLVVGMSGMGEWNCESCGSWNRKFEGWASMLRERRVGAAHLGTTVQSSPFVTPATCPASQFPSARLERGHRWRLTPGELWSPGHYLEVLALSGGRHIFLKIHALERW